MISPKNFFLQSNSFNRSLECAWQPGGGMLGLLYDELIFYSFAGWF